MGLGLGRGLGRELGSGLGSELGLELGPGLGRKEARATTHGLVGDEAGRGMGWQRARS